MSELTSKKVIIFGIGGVGSWCAESLIRSGILNLTIVDSDRVCVTNINRQIMATSKTIGKVKTVALTDRLLEINPKANITSIQKIFSSKNSQSFNLSNYDYIVDAIDSLVNKIHLLNTASQTSGVLVSSMGASLRMDPTRIKVAEFWKVIGCPFGSIIRKRMRQWKELPAKEFLCVYSDEVLENKGGQDLSCGNSVCLCPGGGQDFCDPELANHEWCSSKAVINGTLPHITAIFGFTLAGLIVKDIMEKKDVF